MTEPIKWVGLTALEQAATQALQAMEHMLLYGEWYAPVKVIDALRQALEQPAIWQEVQCPCCGDLARAFPPAPAREWVGLSNEEIAQANKEGWIARQAFESAVWWTEAKLKEKNYG